MEIPERYPDERRRLGARLRALRESASLTGSQAAARAGMSQPKISKIENAVLLPSVEDVDALLGLYGARPGEREGLLELARSLHATYDSARTVTRRGAARTQQHIAAIEAGARDLRSFHLAWVPPLLQTAEYMWQTLGAGTDQAAQVIAARQQRQRALLYDSNRRFYFVLTEGALRVRPGPPALLRTQLDRISSLSNGENMRVGVIPFTKELAVIPQHGFDIYDDLLVTVGLETSTVTYAERSDVARYLELFRELEQDALWGDQARTRIAGIAAELTAAKK